MISKFLKEKKLFGKGYYIHLLFFIVAVLFIGRGIDFHFLTHLINGGDTHQWLNFKIFLEKGIYLWENNGSGLLAPMTFWTIPYNIILFLLNIVISNEIFIVNIFWVGLLYFLQLSFFLFYQLFINRKSALFGALFTIFNVDFFIIFHTPIALNILAYFAFPLMYFLFHSYLIRKRFLFAFFYILFQVILFRTINILIIANLLVPLLFFIFNLRNIKLSLFLKKTIIIWFLSLLIVLPFLVNTFFYYKNIDNEFLRQYNAASFKYQERFGLLNIFRLVPHYSFSDEVSEKPGLYYFNFSPTFLKSPYYIFVSMIPFLLLFAFFTTTRKTSKGLTLVSFLLIFVFFMKGANTPFGIFYRLLLENQIFLTFFRSGAKYFLYFSMPLLTLSLFYYLQLNKRKIYFVVPLIIYMVSVGVLCLFINKPIHKYWDTTLPSSYIEFASVLENIVGQGKYLVLPIAEHLVGYVDYKDGYSGPDRLYTLSDKPILTKMFTLIISPVYTRFMEDIRNNYQLVNNYPNILGYNYIILEKDTVYSPDHKVDEYLKIQGALSPDLWVKSYENDDFILYKLKDGFFNGLIYSLKSKVMFEKVSNTKYNIGLNVKISDTLSFQDSFDSGWKLSLQPITNNEWCHPLFYYSKTRTTECESESGSLHRWFSSFSINKPIFDENYQKKDELGNSWNIDAEYIKRNYSSKYYRENSDGSIDIKAVLYFAPQLYFNLGLLISGATALFCIIYLFFNRKKRIALLKNEDI